MYAYIKGKIEEVSEGSLIIECGGIGYEVFVSNQTAAELSSAKGEVKLYTFYKVAEDDVALYGFARKEEKEMFRKLIAVSGVGPKAALAILSGISLKDLALSIATRDAARLTRIKGVGKKTAERIILELKEKVQEEAEQPGIPTGAAPLSESEEAVAALISLGFSRAEAQSSVAKASALGASKLEDVISMALRSLS